MLKNVDAAHPRVASLGVSEAVLAAYGVGYYSGRGMFQNHVVMPIHNSAGALIAYSGFDPTSSERVYVYPPKFEKTAVLYNLHRAVLSARRGAEGLIVVPDLWTVLRLVDAGYDNGVSLLDYGVSDAQVALLKNALGAGAKLTLLYPHDARGVVDVLDRLLWEFFVKLVRLPEGNASPATLRKLLG